MNPNTDEIMLTPGFERHSSCFKNYMVRFLFQVPSPENQTDLEKFMDSFQPKLVEMFRNIFKVMWQFKFLLNFHIELEQDKKDSPLTVVHHFSTQPIILTNMGLVDHRIDVAEAQIQSSLDHFQEHGSAWKVKAIHQLDLHVVVYRPIYGGHTIPMGKFLSSKKGAILNIQSPDEKCFLYSVLACIHPDIEFPEKFQSYEPFVEEIDWCEYPMPLTSIPKFERLNDIKVLLFGYENGVVFPLFNSEKKAEREVMILLVNDKHFCPILDFNRLLGSNGRPSHFCRYCCQNIFTPGKLETHMEYCKHRKFQRTLMPKPDKAELEFKNIKHMLMAPFTVFADFECLLSPISSAKPDPAGSYTHKYQKHEPSGMAWVMVSAMGEVIDSRVYRGPDCVDVFLTDMENKSAWQREKMDKPLALVLNKLEQNHYDTTDICHICSKVITSDKVRDHDHIFSNSGPFGGCYRGPAHDDCNKRLRLKPDLPVFLHNARNYDQHLIVHALPRFDPKKINVLAQTSERYLCITIDNIIIKDSFCFLSESLDKLAARLENFQILPQMFERNLDLLKKKGVFFYKSKFLSNSASYV